jgi:hypothetical protein
MMVRRTSSVANKEVPKVGPGGTLEFNGNSILEIADVEQFHLRLYLEKLELECHKIREAKLEMYCTVSAHQGISAGK